ncbi:MAG: hypothetical protein PHZ19_12060 [Candidatus Thermoplasmatota archaeon]|nr:hypothetical protein [Candidatus Thermoplasmatota archaeon]
MIEAPPKKTVEELLDELLATFNEGIRMMQEIETRGRDGKGVERDRNLTTILPEGGP